MARGRKFVVWAVIYDCLDGPFVQHCHKTEKKARANLLGFPNQEVVKLVGTRAQKKLHRRGKM
jgi:hypothetical protein